jgi:HEAT repeat protein
LVVACGAAAFFIWRAAWESRHPALAATRGLRSAAPSQRLAAIREVSEQASSDSLEAIGPLSTALDDPDSSVRAAAAQALALIASYSAKSAPHADEIRGAASKLLALLKDRDPTVRAAAASALRILAGSSVGSSGHGKRTFKALDGAKTEGTAVDQRAVGAALLDMLGDPDDAVRHEVIFALGTIGTVAYDEPPKPLLAATEDQSAANRAAAIGTLASFAHGLDPFIPIMLRHLDKDEPGVHDACLSALSKIRPSALTKAAATDLIAGLRNGNRDVRLRMTTLLGRITPDPAAAVPALIMMLKEPVESDVKTMGDRRMQTSYEGPAQEAARALSRIGRDTPEEGAAVAALIEVLRSGPAQRKASAADALEEFGPAAIKAVPVLITMLEKAAASTAVNTDGETACQALARIAPETPAAIQAITALTAALKSESTPTREAAIRALERFGAAAGSAIPALREIAEKEKVPNIRKAAKSTLEAVQDGTK